MALVHEATMRPSKLELLTEWLPGRDWHTGPTGDVRRVAAYRFDDPAGAVGIETILAQAGDGPVHQVPLTYRDAPLAGDDWLITTAEHSVLGKRWIYDAVGDPVYVAVLASAIFGNTVQAKEFTEVDGRLERLEFSMSIATNVTGNVPNVGTVRRVVQGDPTLIETDTVTLAIARRLHASIVLTGTVLTGTWPGQPTPVPLASATPPGHPTT